MRRVYALLAALTAALTLTLGFTGTANATTVGAWGTTILPLGSGATAARAAVAYGTGYTTIAIRYTAGNAAIDGYEILTPTLTYGPDGIPASIDYSNSSALWSGTIAPHTNVTLKYTYRVDESRLNPSTLSLGLLGGNHAAWTGNFFNNLRTVTPPAPKPPFGS